MFKHGRVLLLRRLVRRLGFFIALESFLPPRNKIKTRWLVDGVSCWIITMTGGWLWIIFLLVLTTIRRVDWLMVGRGKVMSSAEMTLSLAERISISANDPIPKKKSSSRSPPTESSGDGRSRRERSDRSDRQAPVNASGWHPYHWYKVSVGCQTGALTRIVPELIYVTSGTKVTCFINTSDF